MKNDVFTEQQVKVLFEKYYIALVEFSSHIVKCDDIALDIVQDMFVNLLERSNTNTLPKEEKSAKGYLYSAVKNRSLNYIRHLKVSNKYHKIQDWTEVDDIRLLDALIYAETVNSLHKAIQSLPKSCQEVCRLTYLEGKSNNEAAELCGVSVNTIKTQKRRSVELLRDRLNPVINTVKTVFFFFF